MGIGFSILLVVTSRDALLAIASIWFQLDILDGLLSTIAILYERSVNWITSIVRSTNKIVRVCINCEQKRRIGSCAILRARTRFAQMSAVQCGMHSESTITCPRFTGRRRSCGLPSGFYFFYFGC